MEVDDSSIQCLSSRDPWTLKISMINKRLDTMENTQRKIVDTLLILKKNQELILANQSQKRQAPRPQTSSTPQPLDHLSPLAHPPPNLPVGEIVVALPSSAID